MANRKLRTREHIIADLSENQFEKVALLQGYSIERTAHDYGYDILMFTYNLQGEIENGYVSVQLKATDSFHSRLIENGTKISFPVEKKDLGLWLKELNPVIIVMYDANNEVGYWLYIQAYFQNIANFKIENIGFTKNIHIPLTSIVNKEAMVTFSQQKTALYNQLNNITHTQL